MTDINFVADQKFEIILDLFRSEYPLMSDVDLIKIGMGGFYKYKLEEKHRLWVASLPELGLSDEQILELESSIIEADGLELKQYSDVDLMMKEILNNNQD